MLTADEIAGRYLGGEVDYFDLKNDILQYGEAMALAAAQAEREACANLARNRSTRTSDETKLRDQIVADIRNR